MANQRWAGRRRRSKGMQMQMQTSRGGEAPAIIGQPCKYRRVQAKSSKQLLLINTANHTSPSQVNPREAQGSPELSINHGLSLCCLLRRCYSHCSLLRYSVLSLPAQSMTRPARAALHRVADVRPPRSTFCDISHRPYIIILHA